MIYSSFQYLFYTFRSAVLFSDLNLEEGDHMNFAMGYSDQTFISDTEMIRLIQRHRIKDCPLLVTREFQTEKKS